MSEVTDDEYFDALSRYAEADGLEKLVASLSRKVGED